MHVSDSSRYKISTESQSLLINKSKGQINCLPIVVIKELNEEYPAKRIQLFIY
jgi:hypothetical protein